MIPITKPTLSPYNRYASRFKEIIESGILTNGKYIDEFEKKVREYLNIKYCVGVSSCTSGLMLALKGLGVKGEVILPSFTFSASGHAVLWNGLIPVFADIQKNTYTIDPESIEKLINKNTGAILATHTFGNLCDVRLLETIARKYKLKLIFDSAHAFGSKWNDIKVGGFGDAEVFSCSPTKVMTAGEGGLIATNNKKLADFCRIGRNYGDDGSYNTRFNGLNARMSEFHSVIGLESISKIEDNLKKRISRVAYFKKELLKVDDKLKFQEISDNIRCTYKDFAIYIDRKIMGYNRDELCDYLISKNIFTKKYFYPPLHLQETYREYKNKYDRLLPVTNDISRNVLSLPMYSHMSRNEIGTIINTVKDFYAR